MKFIYFFALAIFMSVNSFAAPGDTTWVQAHNKQLGDVPFNHDTTIFFPNGSTKYRKIIMIFTLGKYACPGTPTYCSDWDYTVQTFAMNKMGDTVELGRLITPYGKGARMPASWTQPYYFDVTDFATVLKDSNKIRINYSGYSGGFTADVKFAMIEGTPERDVLGVKKMWAGSFAFGNTTSPIDANVAAKSLTAPSGTQDAIYRLNITGHGSDATGCSEFCEKYYQLLKNGTLVKQKSIWRDNCGFNNLYPQSGTWIYNRGNWCPGASVNTNFHQIPGVSSGSTFDLSMAFEPYTSSGGAIYTIFGNVVFYGAINKALDASIEDIIAPTSNDNYFRENNRIGFTTIKIRNTGSSSISNIDFEYGVTGGTLTKYKWSGTLGSLTDTIIDLPFAETLLKASGTDLPYEVNIVKVNGATDVDATNNKLTTTFTPAPLMPNNSVIIFKTNLATIPSGISETSWNIIDQKSGLVVKSRINNAPNTTYYDTLNLPTGVYKLVFSDEGCDGLSFWANPSAGSGSVLVKPTLFSTFVLRGYFSGDFGCGFSQYFRIGNPTNIHNITASKEVSLNIFPNPVKSKLTIEIIGTFVNKGFILLTDNLGRTLLSTPISANVTDVNTDNLANGVYYVTVVPENEGIPKMQSKIVILK